MELNVRGFAYACAALWSAALLLTAVMNLVWSGYGQQFLEAVASLYPGYHVGHSMLQVVLVVAYGYADGLIGGAAFSWVYNRMLRGC